MHDHTSYVGWLLIRYLANPAVWETKSQCVFAWTWNWFLAAVSLVQNPPSRLDQFFGPPSLEFLVWHILPLPTSQDFPPNEWYTWSIWDWSSPQKKMMEFGGKKSKLRSEHHKHVWGFPKMGVPNNSGFTLENPTKMDDDWGGSPIVANLHIHYRWLWSVPRMLTYEKTIKNRANHPSTPSTTIKAPLALEWNAVIWGGPQGGISDMFGHVWGEGIALTIWLEFKTILKLP